MKIRIAAVLVVFACGAFIGGLLLIAGVYSPFIYWILGVLTGLAAGISGCGITEVIDGRLSC